MGSERYSRMKNTANFQYSRMKNTANDKQEEIIHDRDKKKRKNRKRNSKENNKKTTNETDSRRKDTTKQEIILHPEDTTPHSLFPYMRHQQDIDSWILDTTKAKSAGQLSRSVKDRNLGTYRYHYEPDEYAMESEDEEELGWCLKPPKHGSQQDY